MAIWSGPEEHDPPNAARKAIDALNAVTGQNLQFDVTVPSERQRALEAYVP